MDSNSIREEILSDAIQTAIETEKKLKIHELVIGAMSGIIIFLLILLLL